MVNSKCCKCGKTENVLFIKTARVVIGGEAELGFQKLCTDCFLAVLERACELKRKKE